MLAYGTGYVQLQGTTLRVIPHVQNLETCARHCDMDSQCTHWRRCAGAPASAHLLPHTPLPQPLSFIMFPSSSRALTGDAACQECPSPGVTPPFQQTCFLAHHGPSVNQMRWYLESLPQGGEQQCCSQVATAVPGSRSAS